MRVCARVYERVYARVYARVCVRSGKDGGWARRREGGRGREGGWDADTNAHRSNMTIADTCLISSQEITYSEI